MDTGKLIKDIRTGDVAAFRARFARLGGLIARRVSPATRGGRDRDLHDIPVVINNRDRCACLQLLIGWLERADMKRIYIIDNDSTYPPLLEYYRTTPHQVFRLGKNVGHLALWKTHVYDLVKRDYYIYTDPDILPPEECRADFLPTLMKCLADYPAIEKAGLALRIDDLPDHYEHKKKVIDWESQFWQRKVADGIYDAAIDTTFALYRPHTNGALWAAPAYRVAGKFTARHLPWYENSAQPGAEDVYYREHLRQGVSHWVAKDGPAPGKAT